MLDTMLSQPLFESTGDFNICEISIPDTQVKP